MGILLDNIPEAIFYRLKGGYTLADLFVALMCGRDTAPLHLMSCGKYLLAAAFRIPMRFFNIQSLVSFGFGQGISGKSISSFEYVLSPN